MSDVPRPGDLVRLCKSGIPTVTGFMTPDRGLAAGTREVPVGPGMVVAGPVSPRRSYENENIFSDRLLVVTRGRALWFSVNVVRRV